MTTTVVFRISEEVFERFPDYFVACVAALAIDAGRTKRFDELVSNGMHRSRASYAELDLKAQPPFAAWRDAFSLAGWSASRYPASVEAIHKRVQRGGELPRINPPVDLANSAVLYYSVPVGTHDIQTFGDSSLVVREAAPGDLFITMDGDEERAEPGEIVYAVGRDIRTRRWVWRQGRHGLVSTDAVDIFYPIDGFANRTYDAVIAAQNYLAEVCASELGARVSRGLVARDSPAFALSLGP